jgi:MFS transporter, NNP family, nitrate/nitrite transporter
VGGAVGAIGGLGGFLLPLAFGLMNDIADVWTSCFMLLFGNRIGEACVDALCD